MMPNWRHLKSLTASSGSTSKPREVSDAGLAAISHMTSLRELNSVSHRCRIAGLRTLRKLVETAAAVVSQGTLVHGSGLATLRPLTQLRELDLNSSRITDEALPHVAKLTAIRSSS